MTKSNTTKNLFHTVIVAATVVAALGIGARAAEAAQVHVNYADLNINSPSGAAVLYQRIRVAAREVCETSGERDLTRLARAKACADKAIADAVATVANDTLSGVYQAKRGNGVGLKLAAN